MLTVIDNRTQFHDLTKSSKKFKYHRAPSSRKFKDFEQIKNYFGTIFPKNSHPEVSTDRTLIIFSKVFVYLEKKSLDQLGMLNKSCHHLFLLSLPYFYNKNFSNFSPQTSFLFAQRYRNKIKYLDLSNSEILENIKLNKVIKKCRYLKFLNISNTNIEIIPTSQSITELNLTHCINIKWKETKQLSLPKLEILNVSKTNFYKLELLVNQTLLKKLDISDCVKIKRCFNYLNHLKTLEVLNLSGTSIKDLEAVPSSIKELDISFTRIDKLKHFSKLKVLNIQSCDNLSKENIKLIVRFSKLEKLILSWNNQTKSFKFLPPHLKILDLGFIKLNKDEIQILIAGKSFPIYTEYDLVNNASCFNRINEMLKHFLIKCLCGSDIKTEK